MTNPTLRFKDIFELTKIFSIYFHLPCHKCRYCLKVFPFDKNYNGNYEVHGIYCYRKPFPRECPQISEIYQINREYNQFEYNNFCDSEWDNIIQISIETFSVVYIDPLHKKIFKTKRTILF